MKTFCHVSNKAEISSSVITKISQYNNDIANHIASLHEMAAGQQSLEEGDYSLFFRVTEYLSEERYLRVL